ncbi:MAG TPA: ADP-heptose--LPS heptosyltransferase, partial [Candidatus Eisenbacteria bacterium]|nr:ADP-heptose--LPS heptosyltransferase [Candidatus Eisenbacteria bacterium]
PRHLQQVWDGTSPAGKRVLVRCYHGLGDTLQFIRYTPRLRALAAEVVVAAQPELVGLLQTAAGIDRLLALDDEDDAAWEVEIEVMELPHVFRTSLATIPADVPYLHVTPTPVEKNRNLAVGLVWSAGDWDLRRSIAFQDLQPLFEIDEIEFHMLQRGPALRERPPAFGIPSGRSDIVSLARLMRGLDLVVSVDTMTAHLAGALGVPVWNLIHADADWRWLEKRNDSPWYPTMRLFRQAKPGDWTPVIDALAGELRRLLGDATPRPFQYVRHPATG